MSKRHQQSPGSAAGLTAAPLNFPAGSDGTPFRLLLVDDEAHALSSLGQLLHGRGYHLTCVATGGEALAHLARDSFDLVLLDLRLPDIGGHQVMDFINEQGIDADVIVMSGEVGIDAAIGALKRGAYDYLRKPYAREELLTTVGNALEQRRLAASNARIANSFIIQTFLSYRLLITIKKIYFSINILLPCYELRC